MTFLTFELFVMADEEHHDEFKPSKKPKTKETKKEMYARLLTDVKSLLERERDMIANTANVCALLYHEINDAFPNLINWCGFYFLRTKNELVLGLKMTMLF